MTQIATVFTIASTRGAKVIREMLGENYNRVLTSDRWTAYTWLKRRQLCWAYLRRDFQAMIDRENSGSESGKSLLELSDQLFHGWHRVRDRTDSEGGSRFVERMLRVVATCRQQNHNVLEFLTAYCRARLDGSDAPSLLPAKAEPAAA